MNITGPAVPPPGLTVAVTGEAQLAGRCDAFEPAMRHPSACAAAGTVELVPPAAAPVSASILALEEIASETWELFLPRLRRHLNFTAGPPLKQVTT